MRNVAIIFGAVACAFACQTSSAARLSAEAIDQSCSFATGSATHEACVKQMSQMDVYLYTVSVDVDGKRYTVDAHDGAPTAALTVNGVTVRVWPGTSHEGRDFFGRVDVTDIKTHSLKQLAIDVPDGAQIKLTTASGHQVTVAVTNIHR